MCVLTFGTDTKQQQHHFFDQAKQTLVCGTEQHTIVTVDVPDLDRLVEAANGGGDSEQDEFGEDEGKYAHHDKPVEEHVP